MSPSYRKLVIACGSLALLVIGVILFFSLNKKPTQLPLPQEVIKVSNPIYKVIGTSVEGRKIESYSYGSGSKSLVFVGGVHGGYEWNSVLLAYQFIDYLDKNPEFIPNNLIVTVIPDANPDGVYAVTGKVGRFTIADVGTSTKILAAGRFNANNVDLNRNFDCKWKPTSTWQSKIVSAGTKAFSEPEVATIKNFVLEKNPDAVIFWHSQSGSVYASQCNNGILPETLNIMNTYAKASGYLPIKIFDAYATSGAADDWLASINIPAITVELKTHNEIEWQQNLAGIKALFEYYNSKKNSASI